MYIRIFVRKSKENPALFLSFQQIRPLLLILKGIDSGSFLGEFFICPNTCANSHTSYRSGDGENFFMVFSDFFEYCVEGSDFDVLLYRFLET